MNEQQFKDLLAEHDILLTETQEKQFRRYFELLQIWNERLNLTTIIQKEDVYEKHFTSPSGDKLVAWGHYGYSG